MFTVMKTDAPDRARPYDWSTENRRWAMTQGGYLFGLEPDSRRLTSIAATIGGFGLLFASKAFTPGGLLGVIALLWAVTDPAADRFLDRDGGPVLMLVGAYGTVSMFASEQLAPFKIVGGFLFAAVIVIAMIIRSRRPAPVDRDPFEPVIDSTDSP